jgi:hypothetical protein
VHQRPELERQRVRIALRHRARVHGRPYVVAHLVDAVAGLAGPAAARELGTAIAAGGTQQALASVPAAFRPALSDAALSALTNGLTWVLLTGAACVLVALVAAFTLVRDTPAPVAQPAKESVAA